MRNGRLAGEVGRFPSGEVDMGGLVDVLSPCAVGIVQIVWREV
jgi:hypothetical protein